MKMIHVVKAIIIDDITLYIDARPRVAFKLGNGKMLLKGTVLSQKSATAIASVAEIDSVGFVVFTTLALSRYQTQ